MSSVRLYGKNRKHTKGRCYWTDIEAWRQERLRKTGTAPAMVNVTTKTRDWSRELSPILIGPVNACKEGGKTLIMRGRQLK